MHEGRIMQVDTPSGIYEYPGSRFVAEFLGSINLFEGKVIEQRAGEVLVKGSSGEHYRMRYQQPLTIGLPVTVAVRPEKIRLASDQGAAPNRISGIVEEIAYLGDVSIFHVQTGAARRVQITLTNTRPITEHTLTWGQKVVLEWDPDGGVVLPE
jgi:putrescine transport system ATP-binding protein